MASPNVTPNPEVSAVSAEATEAQGKSTIRFPYLDQDDAVKLAKAIHAVAGNSCTRDALAGHLKVSATAGAFNLRMVTAKMFGFVEADKGLFSLTELGKRAIDPRQEKAARAESFLLIPLYKRMFDQYRNMLLPGNPALEKAMEQMGVAPKQTDKARQAFQRSAQQAGFFSFGSDRLIAPPTTSSSALQTPANGENGQTGHGSGSGGDGGGGDDGNQSLIDGLIKVLPKAGHPWPLEAQRKWLQTAAANFAYAYNGTDETRSIKVTIEND